MADWRAFDTIAETYDRVRAPLHEPAARDLVAMLGEPDGGLLDVGTGTGVMAPGAQEAGWSPVVGIDRSVSMLQVARGRATGTLIAADAIDLPFKDGAFAAVTMMFVLHVFKKYETALFDILRVLRAGGKIGVATWSSQEDEFTTAWRVVAETYATKELLRDALRRAAPGQERFADPKRLEETLRDSGLRHVRVERHRYRFTLSHEEYLAGREVSAQGRFLHDLLGDAIWQRFRERVAEEFQARFPDPFGDTNEVLLTVGTKA